MRRVSFLQEDPHTSSKALRLKELCEQACSEGRKVVIYSYFRETIRRVVEMLGEGRTTPAGSAESTESEKSDFAADSIAREKLTGAENVHILAGEITGSTPVEERQAVIDRFSDAAGGSVLVCQIQAGGTGLNIQAASVVIFCEPQIKPSLTRQALSRVYRMGQVRSVLVFQLLCEDTIDEAVMRILDTKQMEFDLFAEESVLADAADDLADREWIRSVIEEERRKYLPAIRPEQVKIDQESSRK